MSKVQKPYKRQFYNRNAQKRPTIDINLKGFLCSCNNREKDCVRESYNLLNKYADVLWPQVSTEVSEEKTEVEDDLQKELQELHKEKKETRRFQVVDSGAKNFLFIKTTLEDPVKLAESIVKEISEKKSQETKFLLRLIPIETTCKAYLKDIEKAFELLCKKHFSSQSKTYSIVFNHRNNNSVSRDEVIKSIADMVDKQGKLHNLEHKVDLKNAEISIIIEVVRGFVFIGVVPNFIKYKKYNLLAFVSDTESTNAVDANVNDIVDKDDIIETSEENKEVK
ncbi:THUMP domain-containing protein 1 homolog [Anthonomus grandis grandis]|uniref:THUMP domain-containing protein 1 homolog n=1 Tax=Anthonomus grandis grandis TaxID=2921223 RepID=UPI002165C041|nr:THUMP domain-containing protein 1 homolog [Anthonomus grandis grandis]